MIYLNESMVNNPYEFRAELLNIQREVIGDGTKRLGPLLQAGVQGSGMLHSSHRPTHLYRWDTRSSCANVLLSILAWQFATNSLKALASAVLDQVFGDAFASAGSILLSRLSCVEDHDVRSRPILLKLASQLTSPCS